MRRSVKIGKSALGKENFLLIAGPCVIESEALVLRTASRLKALAERRDVVEAVLARRP